ncbi:MAG: cytidylate kinase-like family protein [Oscillospiraceae bacterium]|nr:cytidylate kinase-like family protein [Oscillospiraceae bacterium]
MRKIITVSRHYASGGREIGQKLAERLGTGYYDHELLEEAAKNSGIHQSHFVENDEKRTNSFLYLLSTTYGQGGVPFDDSLFFATQNAVRKVASEEDCVIIGRCADYALRDFKKVLNVFITAPLEVRVKRAVEVYGIAEKHAEDYVKRIDKQRVSYYNYYTDKRWGQPQNYHICLDSSALGIDGTVDLLEKFAGEYFK